MQKPVHHVFRKIKLKQQCSCLFDGTTDVDDTNVKYNKQKITETNSRRSPIISESDKEVTQCNRNIDEEILKQYNLKQFSIVLSKDQYTNYCKQQEKLKFLYYFKVMDRNELQKTQSQCQENRKRLLERKHHKALPLVRNRRLSLTSVMHVKKMKQKTGRKSFRSSNKNIRKLESSSSHFC